MNAFTNHKAASLSIHEVEVQLQQWRAELRRLTAAAHRTLDHHPVLAPLVRAPLALQDYVRALRALHGPHNALEATFKDLAQVAKLPGRIDDLNDDLAGLGVAPFAMHVAPPRLTGVSARLGVLYVVEGSHLGGQFIARQLAHRISDDVPRAFFSGSEGRDRWERFWQFAGPQVNEQSLAVIADAANRTFEFFGAHFDQVHELSSEKPDSRWGDHHH